MIPSYNSLGVNVIVDDLRKLENEIAQLSDNEVNSIVQLIISNSEKVFNEIKIELSNQ